MFCVWQRRRGVVLVGGDLHVKLGARRPGESRWAGPRAGPDKRVRTGWRPTKSALWPFLQDTDMAAALEARKPWIGSVNWALLERRAEMFRRDPAADWAEVDKAGKCSARQAKKRLLLEGTGLDGEARDLWRAIMRMKRVCAPSYYVRSAADGSSIPFAEAAQHIAQLWRSSGEQLRIAPATMRGGRAWSHGWHRAGSTVRGADRRRGGDGR